MDKVDMLKTATGILFTLLFININAQTNPGKRKWETFIYVDYSLFPQFDNTVYTNFEFLKEKRIGYSSSYDLQTGKSIGFSGFITGWTSLYFNRTGGELFMGPHVAYLTTRGLGNHGFEAQAGVAFLFIGVYPRGERHYSGETFFIEYLIPLPILSLHYRYQIPNSNFSFRIGIRTTGFGVGIGYQLSK